MMKYILLFFAIILLSLAAFSQQTLDPRLKGLDTMVQRVLNSWHAPGVSIAIVEKNRVLFAGGFGYRDLEKKLPVTDKTLFAIGSCTKAFTCALLGQLEMEGKVSFDNPVNHYLPELRFRNEYANQHVTLRDMMCHRTGLPRHDYSWYGSSATRTELLQRVAFQESTAQLREKWQYNNFMFMAQGMVVEKLSGKSWEEQLRMKILEPLQMRHTNATMAEMEKNTDRSLAYTMLKDTIAQVIPYRNIDAIGPAGSINSCARDMANWLMTWIHGGRFQGNEVIPASFVKEAMTAQMSMGGGLPSAENPDVHLSSYGLGWMLSSYRGHYRVEHGGGIDGFITSTSFFPSDSIGIFVVSSQSGVSTSIRNQIADRLLNLSYRNWSKFLLDNRNKSRLAETMSRALDSSANRKPVKTPHPLNDYAGVYTNPGYGNIKVEARGDSLTGYYNSFNLFLKHQQFDHFKGELLNLPGDDNSPLAMQFHTNLLGAIDKLLVALQPEAEDIVFTRQASTLQVTRKDLEPYAGEYQLGPQRINFNIRTGDILWARISGQPDYELEPIGKDEFNIKKLTGYKIKFERNTAGKVTGASFIQPNGTFKANRIQ